ncbi:MAG: [FeFe] hydrogenase H-cluster radical SAM maturase HydE [Proteobacteria bacterium]|nr:[FeFe] hydrogenase H-cluster radical SAM maturase HydE [Pseudomonadota bacterium]
MSEGLVHKLEDGRDLSDAEFAVLLEGGCQDSELFLAADGVRRRMYGDKVYIRGLIEFSNYCKNNCYYCGIRRDNASVTRYRLSKEEILACCDEGYRLGFRTFVLQGGEDPHYSDALMCDIVSAIRQSFPDCAITLSLGEKRKESYEALFSAGANRYLLRHETADDAHYRLLHPAPMRLENRKRSLFELKAIGYQVGSGFMVGSPFQTTEDIVSDLRFLQTLKPDMIGVGPYIPHAGTPFSGHRAGALDLTLRVLAILRLMFPCALIPSTTALGSIHPEGRELGLKAGANVVMPNLSPLRVRTLYALYENKICTDEEAAESRAKLERRVENAGYQIVTDIGNVRKHF